MLEYLLYIFSGAGALTCLAIVLHIVRNYRAIAEEGEKTQVIREIQHHFGHYETRQLQSLADQLSGSEHSAVIHIRRHVDVHKLGEIEGSLEGLFQVIVIADHVEKPVNSLQHAVLANFRKKVKYLFLVSQRNAEYEIDGYYQIFEALARIAIAQEHLDCPIRLIVEIKTLPYDWVDYPYIFYRTRSTSGEQRTYAYRGEQVREGIADTYSELGSEVAHTIATSVLADAPKEIVISPRLNPAEFEDASNVTPIRRPAG